MIAAAIDTYLALGLLAFVAGCWFADVVLKPDRRRAKPFRSEEGSGSQR